MSPREQSTWSVAIGLAGDESGEGSEGAPTISARGEGASADQVVRVARRFGVPVVENDALARALREVPLDEQVPEELYEAVAAVLNELARLR